MSTSGLKHAAPAEEAASHRPAPRLPKIGYQPGIDGLRAIALLSIFCVHANIGAAPGGFLAVSTFFTLSGFLITALLATEHVNEGRLDLRSFWQRRARRLLPASLMAILLIAIATIWLGDASQVTHVPGDVVGTLFYVANWRFLLEGTTYAGEFSGQSPLLHFWSLAIEEQFYLVFPLVAVVAFGMRRRWTSAPYVVFGLGILGSLLAGVLASSHGGSVDKLYFRTDVRAGELLVGALFGLWWVERGRMVSAAVHRAIRIGGAALLVLMVTLIATSDYHDLFWYRGGLVAYSLVTVGVVLAAVEQGGPVGTALSWKPLVWIGTVSYGAYLIHWPVFMWLFTNTSATGAERLVGGSIVTLAVAGLSYRFLEGPIRTRKKFTAPILIAGGVTLAVAALVVGFTVPRVAKSDVTPLDQAAGQVKYHLAHTAAKPGEAPTVAFFGDSTALITTLGVAEFDDTSKAIRVGSGWAGLGCTINSPARFVVNGNTRQLASSPTLCTGWLENWKKAAAGPGIDAAYVMFGPWEVKSMKIGDSDQLTTIGEPAHDAETEKRLREGLDVLAAKLPVVMVMTSPYIEPGRLNGRSPAEQQPDAAHSRMDRLNAIIRKVASHYRNVAVVDLATWLEKSGRDHQLRPDGVHFTDKVAASLGPEFAATARRVLDVAHGKLASKDDPGGFPVLQWAKVS